MRLLSVFVSLLLASFTLVAAVPIIQPDALFNRLANGEIDLLIDTRRLDEWRQGHIEGATFVDSLQTMPEIPDSIAGCEGACRTIVVYCRSGNRAGVAANLLVQSGFQGEVLNGLGVNQWTEAGYDLVNTTSTDAPCAMSDSEPCPTNDDDSGGPAKCASLACAAIGLVGVAFMIGI